MLRKIFAILQRDWISLTRDAMLIYIAVSPILIGLILRFFLPSVGQTAVNVVLTPAGAAVLEEKLAPYLDVETAANESELKRRVLAYDDAVGILPQQGGGYRLVLEGNESHDAQELPAMVLSRVASESAYSPQYVEVQGDQIPYKQWIATFMGVTVLFLSSIIMGLHLIEDKETRMTLALGVSPLRRSTFVVARSAFVVLFSQVAVFGGLWALGVRDFNPVQILALTVIGSLSSILFGFLVGAISSNQIAGLANIKFGFLMILLPGLLTLLIPERLWIALYWVPTFWVFQGFKAVLVDGAGWSALWSPILWTTVTSLVLLVPGFNWLKTRLDFAQS